MRQGFSDFCRRLIHFNDTRSSLLDIVDSSGTAGVWRIHALNEAGGWKDRTTVEDMDLAVRAGLKGWKFVYLNDLEVSHSAVMER